MLLEICLISRLKIFGRLFIYTMYYPLTYFMENEIELEKLLHKGKEQLALKFKYNINTINTIKQALNPVWSNTQKAWLLPCHNNNVNEIINILHHHHIKVVFKQAINETRVSDESSTKPILTARLNNESLSKLNEFINWLKKNKKFEPEVLLLAPPKDIKKYPGKSGDGDSHIFAIIDGYGVDFTANQFPGISEPLKITPENQIPNVYKKIGGYYTDSPDWFEGGKTSLKTKP